MISLYFHYYDKYITKKNRTFFEILRSHTFVHFIKRLLSTRLLSRHNIIVTKHWNQVIVNGALNVFEENSFLFRNTVLIDTNLHFTNFRLVEKF